MHFMLLQNAKKLLPHMHPVQLGHLPMAEPAVIGSATPLSSQSFVFWFRALGDLHIQSSVLLGISCATAKLQQSICLLQANEEIILKWFLFLTPPQISQVRNLSSERVVKLRSVSGAQN